MASAPKPVILSSLKDAIKKVRETEKPSTVKRGDKKREK